MLTLFEKLFLLAIHEEKGRVIPPVASRLQYALSGAVLAELLMKECIRLDEDQRVVASDTGQTGDEVLDRALAEIRDSKRGRKATYWVRTLSVKPKKSHKQLARRLVEKGVVQQSDTRLMWVVPYADAPEQNASAKYWIKSRLRSLVLTNGEPDLNDLVLLSLAQAAGLASLIFTKDERQMARRRVYELMIGQSLNNPAASSLEEIEAAVKDVVSSD